MRRISKRTRKNIHSFPQEQKRFERCVARLDLGAKYLQILVYIGVTIAIFSGTSRIQSTIAQQSIDVQESIADQSADLQKTISDQVLGKDYVQAAIAILTAPSESIDPGLRNWAVDLLVEYAPISLDSDIEAKLRAGSIKLPSTSEPTRPSTSSAEETLRTYFDHLNSGEYASAWTMQTEGFQFRANGNDFAKFMVFQKSIPRVDIIELTLLGRTEFVVTFLLRLRYINNSGYEWEANQTYTLLFQPADEVWKVNEVHFYP